MIIVTDEEWDFKDLQLHSDISTEINLTPEQRKIQIIKFAKSNFEQIHLCVVVEKTSKNNERYQKIESEFGKNVYMLQGWDRHNKIH